MIVIIQYNKQDYLNTINPEDIVFTNYETMSTGVTNTVVFNYNIDKIDADSFLSNHHGIQPGG